MDATLQITALPPETRIDRPEYAFEDGRLAVSDGEIVALEINEYDASS